MKQTFLSLLTAGVFVLTACNSTGNKSSDQGRDLANMKKDSMTQADTSMSMNIVTVSASYTDIDSKLAASLARVTDHYLHIKNALAKDDGYEAATGGKALEKAFNNVDKSLFTAAQKKTWDELEEEMKEHAEHIGKNGDKIKHQREHFASLSEDIYSLVKAFGTEQPLYHDHCPMYNDNQGAMWLSESKEIKNPYLGSEMPTCGTVEEMIK